MMQHDDDKNSALNRHEFLNWASLAIGGKVDEVSQLCAVQ